MQVISVSNANTNFGLKKGGIINIIFDSARRNAQRQAAKNPAIVAETDRLLRRIQKRAPHSILQTTGADFYLERAGREYYMTDIVPGKGLINSLKNLDIRLEQFDKDVKAGKIAVMGTPIKKAQPQPKPPVRATINMTEMDPNSPGTQRLRSLVKKVLDEKRLGK